MKEEMYAFWGLLLQMRWRVGVFSHRLDRNEIKVMSQQAELRHC